MYGLNAFALLFFFALQGAACGLCRACPAVRRRGLRALSGALLAGNLIRYALIYPLWEGGFRVPVEFSTVAYFVTPAILLFGKPAMKGWAAYSGLLAGSVYYLAMIAAGGPLYRQYPVYDVYLSMLCHGALYVLGTVTAATETPRPGEWKKLTVGLCLVGVYALLLRPLTDSSERVFIYILMDAAVIRKALPETVWGLALPLYYLGVAALLGSTVAFFPAQSRRLHWQFILRRGRMTPRTAQT